MGNDAFELRMMFRSRADARARVRSVVDSVLACEGRRSFSRDDIEEILLAIQESLCNIAKHAYAGAERPIELELVLDGDGFHATILDRGAPVRAEEIVVKDPSEPRGDGRGLFLMRRTMDRVEYGRRGRRNFVKLERRAPPA